MIIIDEDGIMHDVVPTKVLEQIRAEIEQIDAPKDYPYNMVTECVKAEVLQIINKYR